MKVKEILEQNKEMVVSLYKEGKSTCHIGRELGISNASVFVFLRDICKIEIPKHQNKFDILKPEIQQLFDEGKSLYEIGKTLNIPNSTLQRYAKKLNIDASGNSTKRDVPLANFTDEIINEYKSGIGCYRLAKKYNCGETSIISIIKDNDVSLNPKKVQFDENYFDIIDSPAKAWILGWWITDGNVTQELSAARLCITDKDVLDIMVKEFDYTGTIKVIPPRKENHLTQYKLALSSTKICKAFGKLGVVPNKTFNTYLPTIEDSLYPYLIRGMHEGDGTFGLYGDKINCSIIGYQKLILDLQIHLLTKDIKTTIFHCANNIDRLDICGKQNIKKYIEYIYKDNLHLILKRKFDKCQEIISFINT